MNIPSGLLPNQRALAVAALLMAVGASACSQADADLSRAYRTIAGKKFVDLTHSFGPETPVWAGFGQAKFSPTADPRTHQPYTIVCANAKERPTGAWLAEELKHFRAASIANK